MSKYLNYVQIDPILVTTVPTQRKTSEISPWVKDWKKPKDSDECKDLRKKTQVSKEEDTSFGPTQESNVVRLEEKTEKGDKNFSGNTNVTRMILFCPIRGVEFKSINRWD